MLFFFFLNEMTFSSHSSTQIRFFSALTYVKSNGMMASKIKNYRKLVVNKDYFQLKSLSAFLTLSHS